MILFNGWKKMRITIRKRIDTYFLLSASETCSPTQAQKSRVSQTPEQETRLKYYNTT